MQEYGKDDGRQVCVMLRQFLEERYKGTCPVLWGDACAKPSYLLDHEGCLALGENGRPPPGCRAPSAKDASTAKIPPRSAVMKFDSIAIGGGMAGSLRRPAPGRGRPEDPADGLPARAPCTPSPPARWICWKARGDPRAALPAFMAAHPDHPYSKVGIAGNIEGKSGRATPLRRRGATSLMRRSTTTSG